MLPLPKYFFKDTNQITNGANEEVICMDYRGTGGYHEEVNAVVLGASVKRKRLTK